MRGVEIGVHTHGTNTMKNSMIGREGTVRNLSALSLGTADEVGEIIIELQVNVPKLKSSVA